MDLVVILLRRRPLMMTMVMASRPPQELPVSSFRPQALRESLVVLRGYREATWNVATNKGKKFNRIELSFRVLE